MVLQLLQLLLLFENALRKEDKVLNQRQRKYTCFVPVVYLFRMITIELSSSAWRIVCVCNTEAIVSTKHHS